MPSSEQDSNPTPEDGRSKSPVVSMGPTKSLFGFRKEEAAYLGYRTWGVTGDYIEDAEVEDC